MTAHTPLDTGGRSLSHRLFNIIAPNPFRTLKPELVREMSKVPYMLTSARQIPNHSAPSTSDDIYADEHSDQVFLASAPESGSASTAKYQMASTPNDCGLPSTSVLEIDEEAFDATLAGHELSFNDEQTSIDGQYLGTIDDHEEELGNFPWTIDEAHGQYCEDYALLTEAIDALKMVNLERCGLDEAILRYAHAIEAVINRIKIAGMMSIVTVDANGGIVHMHFQLLINVLLR
ncbi:hypothetical protein IFR04_000323 [Cadophora malorum]|uniref:Uncharacterized protein n=1 Tax=Cadophora malorum TaxID=108018 RepID=A0A8H8BWD6_9HELO|nr:hypothetical protein IFR04_000323 [Cadophora malorum]